MSDSDDGLAQLDDPASQTQKPPQLHSYLELGAFPSAVSCARLHAKQVAWEWGLNGLAEAIEMLVSELATNAVQAVADRTPLPFIRLRLSSDTVRLLIEVWDADPRPPASTALTGDGIPPLDQEGGRGLFLVATLSQRWNWYPAPQWGGKVVWCELDVQVGRIPSSDSAITRPLSVISGQPLD
jgi:anti-sigma regulatory factor (Ser/Thr protein kinase)